MNNEIKNIDWWDVISEQEKESIQTGLRQLENGEGIPHEKVKLKVDQLLGRKLRNIPSSGLL